MFHIISKAFGGVFLNFICLYFATLISTISGSHRITKVRTSICVERFCYFYLPTQLAGHMGSHALPILLYIVHSFHPSLIKSAQVFRDRG